MPERICSTCKNTYFSESSQFESESSSYDYSTENEELRSIRTSTPIPDSNSTPASSISDSVNDFFYQSWKSGLNSDNGTPQINLPNQENYQLYAVVQPVYLVPQFVYLYVPSVEQIGYLVHGTFGILPCYVIWNCN